MVELVLIMGILSTLASIAIPKYDDLRDRARVTEAIGELKMLESEILAFYAAKMDACWVGDDRATPQPGGFYGGWVTPNLVGPIKGEPGSEWW